MTPEEFRKHGHEMVDWIADYIEGVGELMKWAVEKGRQTRPDLKVGICGVHGGDPRSIVFCHKIGLNYVSCSAYQIPIARLAAAQITLEERQS